VGAAIESLRDELRAVRGTSTVDCSVSNRHPETS
jgi:hypothetical protein